MMAIKEFNAKGGVLGRPIEAIHMDTETTPATGSRVAERMITRNEAAFLIGALHSGVANAISQVAQKYGCIYLNTNSSSPTEAGQGLPPRQVRLGRQRHQLRAGDRQERDEGQRQELGAADQRLRVGPQHVEGDARAGRGATAARSSTSSWCRRTRATSRRTCSSCSRSSRTWSPPPSAATTSRRCASRWCSSSCTRRMAWINNQQDWPDVYGLGPDAIFGVFGTNWYYRLDLPGVKEFVASYQKTIPGMAIQVPGNVYYNGYMATRELLRCVEEAGTTNNIAVIKKLEGRKCQRARPHAGTTTRT